MNLFILLGHGHKWPKIGKHGQNHPILLNHKDTKSMDFSLCPTLPYGRFSYFFLNTSIIFIRIKIFFIHIIICIKKYLFAHIWYFCCFYPFTNWAQLKRGPVSGNTPFGGSLAPQIGLQLIFFIWFFSNWNWTW